MVRSPFVTFAHLGYNIIMNDDNSHDYNKWPAKRVAAVAALIFTGLMLLGLVLSAIFDPAGHIFGFFLFMVIFVPIIAWVLLWLWGIHSGKGPED